MVQQLERRNLLVAYLEKWARDVGPGFIGGVRGFLGALRDGIRAGQYDLGMPFTYMQSIEVPPASTSAMAVNVENYGEIVDWFWVVTNIETSPNDTRAQCGVTQLAIGAQQFYSAIDNSIIEFSTSTAVGPGASPFATTTANKIGNLRRIPVAQGDVIQVDVRNISASDTYKLSLVVEQYRVQPPGSYPDRGAHEGGGGGEAWLRHQLRR